MKLNRRGINRLLDAGYTKTQLLPLFGVTRMSLNAWMRDGTEPKHDVITTHINAVVERLLKRITA